MVAIGRSSVENFEAVRAYPDLMWVHLDDQGHRDHQNSDVAFQASVVFLDFPLNDLNSILIVIYKGFVYLPIPAGAPPCGGGDIRFGFGVPGVGGFCGPPIGRIEPAPVGKPGAGDVIGP